MSWQSCIDPVPGDPTTCDPIDTIIVPRMREVGNFEVGRVLPAPSQGMIGPFIFVDGLSEFHRPEGWPPCMFTLVPKCYLRTSLPGKPWPP